MKNDKTEVVDDKTNEARDKECKHENREKLCVMDMYFWVCLDCGHQWKA